MLDNLFQTEEQKELFSKNRKSSGLRDELILRIYTNCAKILGDIVECFDENFENVNFTNLMDFVHKVMYVVEEKFDFLSGKEKKELVCDVIILIVILNTPLSPVVQGALTITLYYTLPKLIDKLTELSKKLNTKKVFKKIRRALSCLIPSCISLYNTHYNDYKKVVKKEKKLKKFLKEQNKNE